MVRSLGFAVVALVLALVSAPVAAQTALVMVEQAGCVWCARWNDEIAAIYPRTPEGQAAPLRRIDLHRPIPADLTLASPPRLTPTFILVRDGVELQRMEGYAGEDFFWGLLGMMLRDEGILTPEEHDR